MSYRGLQHAASAALLLGLATLISTPALAQQAGATVDSAVLSNGLCTITGTALDSNGRPACALALASGRCMFTCGPGSLRCEGGTASLPFGKFQLNNLALEANGTVNLQVFVQGNISYTRSLQCTGSSAATARWNAYNNTCCRSSTGAAYPSTYEVTVDGVTKRSVSNSCTTTSTLEAFTNANPGTKNYTASISSSGCGSYTGSGTVTMNTNACYQFQASYEGNGVLTRFGTVDCPASAAQTQTTIAAAPLTILPMLASPNGPQDPTASYQPLQP